MHVLGILHPSASYPPGHVISSEPQVTGVIVGHSWANAKVQKRLRKSIDFMPLKGRSILKYVEFYGNRLRRLILIWIQVLVFYCFIFKVEAYMKFKMSMCF